MAKIPNVDNLFSFQSFEQSQCFLCGDDLGQNKTAEHVFPKWLQNRYQLWDQSLHLQNGTTIRYRQLTIPCCQQCNSEHLASLEQDVFDAVNEGFEKFKMLDEERIWQWISKIFYGLLFKVLSLVLDRRVPDRGTIMSRELMEVLNTVHGYLQSVRRPLNFSAGKPWSIFVFRCHSYPTVKDNFFYHDVYQTLTFSIRMGEIGIIACLNDNGLLWDWFATSFERFLTVPLHPIQFDELAALVTYRAFLINRDTTDIVIGGDEDDNSSEIVVVSLSPRGYSDDGVFLPGDPSFKARILLHYWKRYGVTLDEIFKPPSLIATYLTDENDSVYTLDASGQVLNRHP